jgi:hypothetical protein
MGARMITQCFIPMELVELDGVSVVFKSIHNNGSRAGADKKAVTMVGDGVC